MSAIYDSQRLITDGNISNIDVNYLNYVYKTVFCGEELDLVSLIYLSMMSQDDCIYLNPDISYYAQYLGNQFIFTLNEYIGGTLYQRGYHFYNINDLNDVFYKLINEDYKIDFTFTKIISITCAEDYEYARTLHADSIFSDDEVNFLLDDLHGLNEKLFDDVWYQLDIEFLRQMTINCKGVWDICKNGFDVVAIRGEGSTIKTQSGDRDENKWVTLTGNCIFSASDLTIDGFNTAVENLGGQCIFQSVNFNNNHMDYWFERDWGAAILNGGLCICYNCSFTNNKCGNGGAIFNQGNLTLNNCTFKGNHAEDDGDDVLNVDDGVVYVDNNLTVGSQGCVKYIKSMSDGVAAVVIVLGVVTSFLVGAFTGTFTLNPAIGILAGACVGACIGVLVAHVIIETNYNINANRYVVCVTIIAGCTLAGALGGYLGTCMQQSWVGEAAQNGAVEEEIQFNLVDDSSFSSEGSVGSEWYEALDAWYTDQELDELIANAPSDSASESSLHLIQIHV